MSAQAIQDGADDGAAHPFAVGVCIGNKGACDAICSGALITPNLVVTARHCVQNTDEQISCGTSTFGASLATNWITTSDWMFQSTPAASWHSVSAIKVPTDDGVCGNDLALLELSDVIDSSEATPVIPGVQYYMGDTTRYLYEYTAIGYGKTSEADPAASDKCFQSRPPATPENCPGWRRIKEDIGVLCIPGDPVIDCGSPKDPNGNPLLTANEFVGGEGVCGGDSGSSAFEQATFNDGAPVTLGILSRGGADSTDSTKCGDSVYTRLDQYRDLIVNTANDASQNWTLYPKPVPDWTIYVPPATADAGAEGGTPTTTTSGKQGNGVTCTTADDCTSGICHDVGDGLECTTTCTTGDDSTCTGGYVCSTDGFCVEPTTASGGTTEVVKKSGCSVASPGSLPGEARWSMFGMVTALGLMLNTRRASRRRTRK